ncbi:hypothetical protein J2Y48_005095 [Mycoplana sp. BE70]|nr:hypothetical protein [Mycoplana sp. BE70]
MQVRSNARAPAVAGRWVAYGLVERLSALAPESMS